MSHCRRQRRLKRWSSEYKDAIERRLADPLRTRIPAAERLYQLLIAPVRPWIPAGSRVILATDGALHGLNLEALPQPPSQPGGAPRYWIEDVTREHRTFAGPACGACVARSVPRAACCCSATRSRPIRPFLR